MLGSSIILGKSRLRHIADRRMTRCFGNAAISTTRSEQKLRGLPGNEDCMMPPHTYILSWKAGTKFVDSAHHNLVRPNGHHDFRTGAAVVSD